MKIESERYDVKRRRGPPNMSRPENAIGWLLVGQKKASVLGIGDKHDRPILAFVSLHLAVHKRHQVVIHRYYAEAEHKRRKGAIINRGRFLSLNTKDYSVRLAIFY